MYYSDRSFFSKNTLLNEEVYNVKEFREIDNCFQRLIDSLVESPEIKKSREVGINSNKSKYKFILEEKIIDTEFTKIEKIVKKVFNIDLNIKLDLKTKNLEYFACIFITKDDVKKATSNIEEIIKDEKYGYHYIKIKKAECLFQWQTFVYIKQVNENPKNYNCEKITGKHLTAVLLHELGHKIYLKFAYNKSKDDGSFLISINDNKPKIIKTTSQNKKKNFAEIVALTVSLILFYIVTLGFGALIDYNRTKEYSRVEGYSDRLAIKYGYGKEIYQFFLAIEKNINGMIVTKKSPFIYRFANATYMRKNEMKANIQREINDPSNNKQQIESLKQILKYIETMEEKNDIPVESDSGDYTYLIKKK